MDVANEILDAIEIIVDKKIRENTVQIYPGVCKSVSGNSCIMSINGRDNTVQFYGSTPAVGSIYRVFVPNGNMSMAFIIAINDDSSSEKSASIFVTGLSETDTVTASKDGKTVIGKWTQKSNPVAHGLPDGYTELSFIKSDGSQCIDTNILMDGENTIVEFENIAIPSWTENWACIFGTSDNDGNTPTWWIRRNDNKNDLCFGIGGQSSPYYNYHYDISIGTVYESMVFQRSGMYVNSELAIKGNDYGAFENSAYPMYLFSCNQKGNSWRGNALQINICRIRNENTIQRILVSCKRNSDGAIGMYDLVSDTFFGNIGTGTFTAGTEIPKYINGFSIAPIKSYGTWTVSNADHTKTADVLIDAPAEFEVTL